MWFTPLGTDTGLDTVAEVVSAALSSEDPNLRPVSTIARFNRVQIQALNFQPPVEITGTGGAIAFSDGFKIHSFTDVGNQTLTFNRI
jgi:hypothetical protein